MSGSDQQELQQLSEQLEQVESQLEALHTERQTLRARKVEIDDAIEAIESLDTGSTVQVPIGGGARIRADIADIDEIIVQIGSGYATERTEGDACSLLEDRKDRIDERIEELNDTIAQLETEGEELGQEAQQRLQRLQQQQGGGGLPGAGGGQGG